MPDSLPRPTDRLCPECGEPLRPKATRCRCGWGAKPIKAEIALAAQAAFNRNRCAWQSSGERCRYIGTIGSGLLGQGDLYCREHFRPVSLDHAHRVLQASLHDVPSDFDYSTRAIAAATEKFYREQPIEERYPRKAKQ